MTATLSYPPISPVTIITFDAISKVSRQREATKVLQKGDLDRKGVVESAGTSLLKLKVSFEFKSDTTKSAIEKWDEFDSLIRDKNEFTMRFSITYETELGNKTQYYDGKVTGMAAGDVNGDPDLITATFSFTVEEKGVIT